MKVEILLADAKQRITKMINDHCWDVIKDLLNEINESSDSQNVNAIQDIEITLDIIKNVQEFKQTVSNNIETTNTLHEILSLCQSDIIKESEEDILTAFFGYEIKIKK